MAIKYGSTTVTNVNYNGVDVDKVIYNGTTVFQKVKTATQKFEMITHPPANTVTVGYEAATFTFEHTPTNLLSVELSGTSYNNTVKIPTKNVVALTRLIDNTAGALKSETVTAQLTGKTLTFPAKAGGATSMDFKMYLEFTYEYIE